MAEEKFNYKNKQAPKLTDEFKKKFFNNIKGKEAIKAEGLTALAHEKGIWKLNVTILQFPNNDNNWTAICQCVVGGYDWDPIKEEVREVEYTEIGDANEHNCTKQVAASYIRMAATRATGRALRKYTNIDMVCSEELAILDTDEPFITTEQLTRIKNIIKDKGMNQEKFKKILFDLFQHTNYTGLTESQGKELETKLKAYVKPTDKPATDNQ